MPIDFEPIDQGGGIDFEPIETPKVKKKSAADIVIEQPQARERLTIGGEIKGGLEQLGAGISAASKPAATLSELVERGDQAILGGLGLLRSTFGAATAPLTNVITSAGEGVSDVLQKLGFNTAADVAGGLTTVAGDVLTGIGPSKLLNAARSKLIAKLPNASEKLATSVSQRAGQEAAINAEAAAARQQALQAQQAIQANAQAAIGSEESIGQAASDFARQQARQAKAKIPTRATLQAEAPGGVTSATRGQQLRAHYEGTRAVKSQAKEDLYNPLMAQGEAVTAERAGYDASIKTVLGEKGVSGPFPTRAEQAAKGAQPKAASLAEDEVTDQIDALEAVVKGAASPEAKVIAQNALGEFVKRGDLPVNPTVAQLIQEQKRYNAAIGASRNDQLTRQLKILKTGVEQDIEKASPGLATQLQKADKYYAEEYAPLFTRGSSIRKAFETGDSAVIDQLVPRATDKLRDQKLTRLVQFADTPAQQATLGDGFIANMVGDAEKSKDAVAKLRSVWNLYADPRSDDKVLRTVLGTRYDGLKELATSVQIKPTSIDAALKTTLKNIESTTASRTGFFTKAQSDKLKTLEGVLGEGEKFIEGVTIAGKPGSIEAARTAKLEALQKEFDDKLKRMQPSKVPTHAGELVGGAMVLHGGVGLLMGSAAAVPQIISGGIVMLSAPLLFKMMQSARGLELLNKAMRATPGTVKSAALARLVSQYTRTLKEENE